jgi:hypothetical protein
MRKKALFILVIILTFSCSSSKRIKEKLELSKNEKEIINNFLENELASEAYRYRINNKIVVIETTIPKKQVLSDYLSLIINYKKSLIDSIHAVKMNRELEKEPKYYWKSSDFRIKNLQTQSSEDFRKTIKTEEYFNLPNRIIFHLSVPLLINDKEALISFMSGSGDTGFTSINSGIVLMTKNNENEWVFKCFLGSPYS